MLVKLMGKQADDIFNEPFQPNEILQAAKAHKNGKSDLISNEMIRYGFPVLIEPILKLFNLIFEKGDFSKLWNERYITLLHKKGKEKNLTLQTTEGSH